jgi:hypothetical protein
MDKSSLRRSNAAAAVGARSMLISTLRAREELDFGDAKMRRAA